MDEAVYEEDVSEGGEDLFEITETKDNGFDEELEEEILYHLSFFPSGVSSPMAIKSILIDKKEVEIEDIIHVLKNSPRITRNGNKWVLKG